MWQSIDPAVLAVLPKQALNGASVNGTHPTGRDWSEALQTLERFRKEYAEDDWDGQGAQAISHELLDGAAALAESLQNHGVIAPKYVLPSVQATVDFEWDLADGASITFEVIEPGAFEVFLFTPGKPTAQYILSRALTT